MSFNTDKSKVTHIGNKNPNFKYKMRDQELDNVKQEKELSIIINCNIKVSDQFIAISKKANRMLGLISRNFDYKAPEAMDITSRALTSRLLALQRSHIPQRECITRPTDQSWFGCRCRVAAEVKYSAWLRYT